MSTLLLVYILSSVTVAVSAVNITYCVRRLRALRRREARWQATYEARCKAAHVPPWERKAEVAARIADAKVRMGL